MSIKRWKLGWKLCNCVKCEAAITIEETEENCGWVTWGDHKEEVVRLKAEVERLKANESLIVQAQASAGKSVVHYIAEIEGLKAEVEKWKSWAEAENAEKKVAKVEVERLTKAKEAFKDAIAVKIARLIEAGDTMAMTLHYEGDGYALNNWNAAKKGGQQ